MEWPQLVGLAILAGLGFVVHSTVKLMKLRRAAQRRRPLIEFREIAVLLHPGRYDPEEVRLVRRNFLACLVVLALVVLFLAANPDGLRLEAPD